MFYNECSLILKGNKIMQINSAPNYQPNFRAVRFKPAMLKEWNTEILEATVKSDLVKETIRKNEAAGKDTILEFATNYREIEPYSYSIDHFSNDPFAAAPRFSINLSIEDGAGNISDYFTRYDKHFMYSDMVRDICEKLNGEGSYIYGQSNSALNKSTLENLEELKKLSSEVVYDNNGLNA